MKEVVGELVVVVVVAAAARMSETDPNARILNYIPISPIAYAKVSLQSDFRSAFLTPTLPTLTLLCKSWFGSPRTKCYTFSSSQHVQWPKADLNQPPQAIR